VILFYFAFSVSVCAGPADARFPPYGVLTMTETSQPASHQRKSG